MALGLMAAGRLGARSGMRRALASKGVEGGFWADGPVVRVSLEIQGFGISAAALTESKGPVLC